MSLLAPGVVFAQSKNELTPFKDAVNSGEIMLFAIFAGAMSFALLSAWLMIRERMRLYQQNGQLRDRIAGLRATNERLEALVSTNDQRTIVWNGYDDKPVVMGKLPKSSGAPEDQQEFLTFGSWLVYSSLREFDTSLNDLKQSAASFDLTLETRSGGIIEVQGRTSGSHAFVRFIELGSEREALAALENEHSRLLAVFDSIQALFENINIPVWLKDRNGNLIWVNTSYAKAVEAADGETATRQNLQLLDRTDLTKIEQAQSESEAFHGSLNVIVAGDQQSLLVTDVKTSNGTAGLAINKQELEALKASLKRTMESHAKTLDQINTAIAIFDKKQRLQFHNASFESLWGLDPAFLDSGPDNGEVLDAMRAQKRLPEVPDWRKWRSEQLEIYRQTEKREDWWYLPDGQTIRVIVHHDAHGGTAWIFENVTEEMALKSKFNSLVRVQDETLDHLNEAVAVFGTDGLLKFSNSSFERLWQENNVEFGNAWHIREFAEKARDLVKDEEPLEDIVSYITSVDTVDDTSDHLEFKNDKVYKYSMVSLPDGQSMLTLIDVTDQVNVERALQERNEALMESDRVKTRFIQHVSYELRVPLTTIFGFSQMMQQPVIGKLNEKQAEYLDHIFTSAQDLSHIVDNILDLATVDAGAMDLFAKNVEVDAVIDACIAELQPAMDEHCLTIKKKIGKNAGVFFADETRFSQILHNLLANAASFSPDGGTIIVATRNGDNKLELMVADDGVGVAAEYRDRIFNSFESGVEFSERRKGAGLGLTIVKSFVELHGGEVTVDDASQFGLSGACFTCTFPVNDEAGMIAAE